MKIEDLDKILDKDDYSWIKVEKVEAHFDDFRDHFSLSLNHHMAETNFLINKCRELAQDLKKMKEYYE